MSYSPSVMMWAMMSFITCSSLSVPDSGATISDTQVQLAVLLEEPVTAVGGEHITLYMQGFPSNGAIFSGLVPDSTIVQQGSFVGSSSMALLSTGRARGYISVIAEMDAGGGVFHYAFDVIPVAAKP